MTIKTGGGLVRISGEVGMAANEDRVAESAVVDERSTDGASGWDPYEVWRTRVKKTSATHGDTDAGDSPR